MILKEDNDIVYDVIHGKVSSFEILIDRYQKAIFNLVFRMVGNVENAKDITQDIFIRSYEKLDTFNFKYKYFSWLYRIAINETINWLKRNPVMDRIRGEWQMVTSDTATEDIEQKSKKLELGLMELSENYRSLLILKYYSGLSYEEIAAIKNITVKKVRSRLFIAREELRKILALKGVV
ncbi:MAG: RNA polymerase sigma factor [Bacteroidota bacterium]